MKLITSITYLSNTHGETCNAINVILVSVIIFNVCGLLVCFTCANYDYYTNSYFLIDWGCKLGDLTSLSLSTCSLYIVGTIVKSVSTGSNLLKLPVELKWNSSSDIIWNSDGRLIRACEMCDFTYKYTISVVMPV